MIIYPQSRSGVLLFGRKDEQGTYYFSDDPSAWPGVSVRLDPRLPVFSQLTEIVIRTLEPDLLPTEITWHPTPRLLIETAPDQREELPLYVGESNRSFSTAGKRPQGISRCALPDLLKRMPANKHRIAYVKAWQLLLGADKEELKAVEAKDLPPSFLS